MMAHSDVFLTVYSTMVVEASIHATPIVSVTIDSPTGWPGEYTLPLTKIGGWPTHSRFRQAGAGRVADKRSRAAPGSQRLPDEPRHGPPGPSRFRSTGMYLYRRERRQAHRFIPGRAGIIRVLQAKTRRCPWI